MPYTKEIGKTPTYEVGFVTLTFTPKKCAKVYAKLRKIGIPVRRSNEHPICSLTFQDNYETFALESPKWYEFY